MEEPDNQLPSESPEPTTTPVESQAAEAPPETAAAPVSEDVPDAVVEPGLAGAPIEALAERGVEEAAAADSPTEAAAEPGGEAGPVSPEAVSEAVEPEPAEAPAPAPAEPTISVDELMQSQPAEEPVADASKEDVQLKAILEAIVYVAEEPLTSAQIAASLHEPEQRIRALLEQLMAEFEAAGHGVCIREIAGGFKMATKAEHHDAVRNFVKSLKPPLKLSLPALETLSVIAYKQPVTGPEIMEIRGVQGGGVLKTLLDRKLIAAAGRKNVIGKPILYKTTKEFLIQFGLKDLSELPSLKEFEEIRRMAFDGEPLAEAPAEAAAPAPAENPGTAEASPETAEPPAAAEPAESDEPAPAPEASQES
jgi:segregation and condensation protein B